MSQTPPDLTDLTGYCVLVVDDEKPVLDLIVDLLQASGATVDGFTSPSTALQKAKHKRYDALVLDVYMPELPGMLFHAKLKLLDAELAKRTVFVSGYFTRDELRRDLEQAAMLLPKPFTADELLGMVAKMVPPKPRSGGA